MENFLQRHAPKIVGTLSCLDRVIIRGTLPTLCYKEGMASYLFHHGISLENYLTWAAPYRDQIVQNAEHLAAAAGLKIQVIRKFSERRKEEIVQECLQKRGGQDGLVCVLSAMESCPTYRNPKNSASGQYYLKADTGKCLHYYFYFIDPTLGLIHVRVPTWAPFGLQCYFNGHSVLERKLRREEMPYTMLDNSFAVLGDFRRAQELADTLLAPEQLHGLLDDYAARCCPGAQTLEPRGYHWSLAQVEYSTDVVFTSQAALAPLYQELTRTAICALGAEHVANFLGRKLHPNYKQEISSDFALQVEGRRIKHRMGPSSVKMYDKFGLILRVETTTSDVSSFKHHRRVEHKDGRVEFKEAPMRKSIYSLLALQEAMGACNRRYLAWLGAIEDPSVPLRQLDKLGRRVQDGERSSRGFNMFAQDDLKLFETLMRGEFTLRGFRNRDLREKLGRGAHQVSHLLKGLRLHGLIKKAGKSYRYYVTSLGQRVLGAGLRLRQALVIPALGPKPVEV